MLNQIKKILIKHQFNISNELLKDIEILISSDKIDSLDIKKKYNILFEQAKISYQSLDINGNILEVNTTWLSQLGYKKNEVIGKCFGDFMDKESAEVFKTNFKKFISEGHISDTILKLKKKNGEFVLVSINGYILRDANNIFKSTYCSFFDITEQQNVLNKLKENEEKYRRLTENSPNITYIYSLKRGALYWSSKVKDILGFNPDNLIVDSKKWDNALHKEDRLLIKKHLGSIKPGNTYEVEYRIYDINNNLHWFNDKVFNVYKDKGEIIIEGIITDITSKKETERILEESEEKFRTITNSAQDAIILINNRGNIIFWNKAAEIIFQYQKSEVIDKNLHNILAPSQFQNDYKKALEIFAQTGSGNAINKILELTAIKKDGTHIPVELSLSSLKLNNQWNAVGIIRDISERKIKEIELKESEERFKLLSELTFEGIVIHKNGIAIDCNQSFLNILGYNKDEIIGKNMLSIIHKDYHDIVKSQIPNEKSLPYEILGIKKDKTLIPIELEAKTTTFNNEKTKVVAVRDITERKKVQNKFIESEKKYHDLFEFSPNASVIIDLKGFVKDCNNTITDYTGLLKNELIGKHFTQLPLFSGKQIPTYLKIFKNMILKKEKYIFDYEWIHKNGEKHYGTAYIAPILKNNKIIAFHSSTIDLTEKKKTEKALLENEKKFRTYIENSPLSIFILDNNGNFEFVNNAATILLGYTSKELLKNSISIIHFEEDLPDIINRFDQLKIKEKASAYETRIIKKNGDIAYVIIDSVKMSKDQFLGFLTDITEIKNIQHQISLQNEELNALNITKDKFFSIIAHDLRGPINTVVAFSDLISKKIEDYSKERISQLMNLLNESAKQTALLLENLLMWSRSQRKSIPYAPQIYHCKDLINNIFTEMRHLAAAKNIEIKPQGPIDNFSIFADKEMFKTIFRNLISNAIKYTNFGGEITIGCGKITDNFCEFFVQDNGVGISNDILPKLFKIDQHVTTDGTNKEKGTGLGLVLCKDFVNRHGGNIWVESKENEGSTFYFTIPISETYH